MDLSINDFDISVLISSKKCLILGDKASGKSSLIKDMLSSIHTHFPYGFVFTDIKHSNSLYSLFLNTKYIYKRYSSLLANRCFVDNTYVILDDYYYNKEKYTEIFHNVNDKKILLLISLTKFTDFTGYDYIFLCKFSNIQEIYKIYINFIQKINKSMIFEQFIELIKCCTQDYEVLVINCNPTNLDDLFFCYTFDIQN